MEADPKWTQNFQCASASDSEKIMAHRSALFSRCFRTSFLCLLHVVLAAQATLPATSFDDGVLTEFVAKVRFAKCASHLSSLATAARKHGENASTTKMAALYEMRSPGTRLSLTACDLGVLPRHGPTGLNNSHGCQHTLCEHDRAFNGIRVHPLPTGIGNQMQYSNAFLAVAATTSSWVLHPPVLHMDGYHPERDYTLPFFFIFDRAAFEKVTRKHRLRMAARAFPAAPVAFQQLCACTAHRVLQRVKDLRSFKPRPDESYIIDGFKHAIKRRLSPSWYSVAPYLAAPFSPDSFELTSRIVSWLRSHGGFFGAHLRVELSADRSREAWIVDSTAPKHIAEFGNTTSNIRKLCYALRNTQKAAAVRYVYTASFLPPGSAPFKLFGECLAPSSLKVVTKFDFYPQIEKIDPSIMTRNLLALIEMSVLEQAGFFVGNRRSSFSTAIAERRASGNFTENASLLIQF